MRRGTALLLVGFLAMLSVGTGCKQGVEGPDLSAIGPSSAATTTVLQAGGEHCPGGGLGIYTGKDGNANGVLDAAEVLDGKPVCNPLGDDGKTPLGLGTLVMVVSEPSGTTNCPAGGLKVLSGADANGNGALDADEVLFANYFCNGTPGSSSAAGITMALGPVGTVPADDGKKKGRKSEPVKKQQTARAGSREKTDTAAGTEPAPAPKKAAAPVAASKERSSQPKPAAAPQGWNSVKVNSPDLASVAYKIDGTYIVLRFKNLSSASTVRYKYTVRWKVNRNGNWVEDSSAEGLSFRLKPQDSLDREVRTQAKEVRDVVVDLEVSEST